MGSVIHDQCTQRMFIKHLQHLKKVTVFITTTNSTIVQANSKYKQTWESNRQICGVPTRIFVCVCSCVERSHDLDGACGQVIQDGRRGQVTPVN